jgi:uncharacterized membrane protein (UPF0127 family)
VIRAGAIAIGLAWSLCACSSDEPAGKCEATRVRIASASDGKPVLDVCAGLAVSEEERVQGLTGKPPLALDQGLLLEFPLEGDACIQNGSVSFAIDVVYASDSGEVVAVEHAVAAGDATLRCHSNVKRVLEVDAGVADAVEVGDTLKRS